MDPSDRFTHILDCGCAYEQGSWSYCAQHLPSFHERHTTPVVGCDRCDDLLDEAREIQREAPWNEAP